jgi:CHAT domain
MTPEPREPIGSDGVTEPIRAFPGAPAADLTVQILDRGPNEQNLLCKVWTPFLPGYRKSKAGEWDLPAPADEIVLGAMEDFTLPDQSADARIRTLVGAGVDLFKAAPPILQEVLLEMRKQQAPVGKILFASEDRSYPWELMIPVEGDGLMPGDEELPLGARFNVGRWYEGGLEPPEPTALSEARVVQPDDRGKNPPLTHAEDEQKFVVNSFSGQKIDPALVGEIDRQLDGWTGSLLHFVCHGETPTPMTQRLLLDGSEKLMPRQIKSMTHLRAALGKTHAAVFLNACEAGRSTIALKGTGGFVKNFVTAKARVVIAPLWSVDDEDAHDVATQFYKTVLAEPQTPFGEILTTLRRKAYEDGEGRDTYAAYCLYGDPGLAAAA